MPISGSSQSSKRFCEEEKNFSNLLEYWFLRRSLVLLSFHLQIEIDTRVTMQMIHLTIILGASDNYCLFRWFFFPYSTLFPLTCKYIHCFVDYLLLFIHYFFMCILLSFSLFCFLSIMFKKSNLDSSYLPNRLSNSPITCNPEILSSRNNTWAYGDDHHANSAILHSSNLKQKTIDSTSTFFLLVYI